jgi:hypothetical protein
MNNLYGRKKGGEKKINLVLNNRIPDVFILNEEDKSATWDYVIPDEYKVLLTFRWCPTNKTSRDIKMVCKKDVKDLQPEKMDFDTINKSIFTYRDCDFLERQLEHCYLEKKTEIGIKTIMTILKTHDNMVDGLKHIIKLSLINILKYSILCCSFSYLMWIYMALEGEFKLNNDIIKTILNICAGSIDSKIFDNEWKYTNIGYGVNIIDDTFMTKLDGYNTILESVILSRNIINKSNDRIMLDKIIYCWLKRIEERNPITKLLKLTHYGIIKNYECLEYDDILIDSYALYDDNNKIIKELSKEYYIDSKLVGNIIKEKHYDEKKSKNTIIKIEEKYNINSHDNDKIWEIMKERYYELLKIEKENMLKRN